MKLKTIIFLSFIFLFLSCSVSLSQSRKRTNHSRTRTVYVRDTVYIRDTVWIKDGIAFNYDPYHPEKYNLSKRSSSSDPALAMTATSDPTYRFLADSLHTFGIQFNRDSLAKIILENDPVFLKDWDTGKVHFSKTDINELPPALCFDLVTGYEKFRYNWFGAINCNYGPRWGRMHKGIDTELEEGDSLLASFNGIVRYADYNDGGYGNCVVIRHFNGLETLYGHMSELRVKPGDLVFTGDLIGFGGNTGRSEGSHLHFETRYKSHSFDPFLFLNKDAMLSLKNQEFLLRKEFLRSDLSDGYFSAFSPGSKSNSRTPAVYVVRRGDTLYSIAKKYKVSPEKLVHLNKLKNKGQIRAGQKLKLR